MFFPSQNFVRITTQVLLIQMSESGSTDDDILSRTSSPVPNSDAHVDDTDHDDASTSSSSVGYVPNVGSFAYDDEPIAEPGEIVETPDDPDGILPADLEQRSDGTILLNEW